MPCEVLRVRREGVGQLGHRGADLLQGGLVVAVAQGTGDEGGDLHRVLLGEALGGHRGRADAQAGRAERRARVVGDRIEVQGDALLVEVARGVAAREVGIDGPQVDAEQVVVGAA